MHLCVGAASRRVIEEAAKLRVPQIVASRRQVDIGGGYIGFDQHDLVERVKELSGNATMVIRDHGGPGQSQEPDSGIKSFDADVKAGFGGLHLDVSKLNHSEQRDALKNLLQRYGDKVPHIEIGGERDAHAWLSELLATALMVGVLPQCVVLDTGVNIWNDRSVGSLHAVSTLLTQVDNIHNINARSKAHNADWLGNRQHRLDMVDYYNVCPEFGALEVDTILMVLPPADARQYLTDAYQTRWWHRWFTDDEGTWLDRARCAMRYIIEDIPPLGQDAEHFVRNTIREAIACG